MLHLTIPIRRAARPNANAFIQALLPRPKAPAKNILAAGARAIIAASFISIR
jgi:hypothetical protein